MPPGQDGKSELLALAFECAANVESAVVRCACPQLGHRTLSPFRTSFSNFVPQSSHTYSKIGISLILHRQCQSTPTLILEGVRTRITIAGLTLLPLLFGQDPPPRSKASDYPVHITLQFMELGAEYLVHSIPGPRGGYFTKEFLVVEVALFPATKDGIKISSAHFTLKINNKSILTAQSSGMVAAALKYPDWEQRPNMTAQAGPLIFGAPPSVGRFPGDQRQTRPLPAPRVPDQTGAGNVEAERDLPIEEAIAKAALPEGVLAQQVKGCLFFRFEGKLKSIKSLDLMYDAGDTGPKAKITLL